METVTANSTPPDTPFSLTIYWQSGPQNWPASGPLSRTNDGRGYTFPVKTTNSTATYPVVVAVNVDNATGTVKDECETHFTEPS